MALHLDAPDEYAAIAPLYDPIIGPFLSSGHRLVARSVIAQGRTAFLDICCGTGALLKTIRRIATQGSSFDHALGLDIITPDGAGLDALNPDAAESPGPVLTGVDFSEAMLAVARRQSDADLLVRADATRMPFADGAFDAAALTFALHEKPPSQRDGILSEALRVLQDGGSLFVADYLAPRDSGRGPLSLAARAGISLAERAAGREHHRNQLHFLEHGGLRGLLTRHGLSFRRLTRTLFGAAAVMEISV